MGNYKGKEFLPFYCISCGKDFPTSVEVYYHVCDNKVLKKEAVEMGQDIGVAVGVSQ